MTQQNQKSRSSNLAEQEPYPGTELRIYMQHLVERLNVLTSHARGVEGKDPAEKNAREISIHLKNIKDLIALHAIIVQEQDKKVYTRYEDLPPPHPDDIAAFRRRLRRLVSKHTE